MFKATYLSNRQLSFIRGVPELRSVTNGLDDGDVPNVVVSVSQELSQNINRHHSQPILRLDLQNRQHRLVENRVSNVLG